MFNNGNDGLSGKSKRTSSIHYHIANRLERNDELCNISSDNNVNANNIGDSIVKTPKSALLEKRRKAVFELLTKEIYPSGKHLYI